MRILILSDVHANLPALEAVLSHAQPFDMIWDLGDIVGYGPYPNECVERLQEFDHISVAGNHDWAALGRLDLAEFNAEARWAAIWTADALRTQNRTYLESLPTRIERDDFTLVHGSPREPVWEYILYSFTAGANFAHFSTPYCLVGHTHSPVIFVEKRDDEVPVAEGVLPTYDEPIALTEARCIFNPGGVGQPRDGDRRAGYLMLDTEKNSLSFHRVEYPIEKVQTLMDELGFPPRLIARLSYGW